MMFRHYVFAGLFLAVSLIGASEAKEPLVGLRGAVTYEVASWGTVIDRWQVLPDGTGEIWRSEQAQRPVAAGVKKFRLHLSPAALAEFTKAVDAASRAARKKVKCKKDFWDAPYGSVKWDYPGEELTFNFDTGCRSKSVEAVMFKIGDADRVIQEQARIDSEPFEVVAPE